VRLSPCKTIPPGLALLHDDQTIQSHDGRHSYKLALMRFALDRALDLIHSSFNTVTAVRGEALSCRKSSPTMSCLPQPLVL